MPDVVLATINARYIHSAFGLRYLAANLGEHEAQILEFTGERRPVDIAEAILRERPSILGLGVYIWNATASRELVSVLARVAPDLTIVLGGPEVSHEYERQEIVASADYLITGEGEVAFRDLCGRILGGKRPLTKVIDGGLPSLDQLRLPYHLYTDHDIAHRVLYVEASRGCPYRCEFCLSSLDKKVRAFPLDELLQELQSLIERGARSFKFVDRTFNLDLERSRAILEFLLEREALGLFAHFEMVPDRLPEQLREIVTRFRPGALQFEVGIQTFDPEVGARISRRQDLPRTESNLEFLRTKTGVHLHTDLVAGLPGESIDQFAHGFDRLVALQVQEIQVGILKRLRGTPIARHDAEYGMVYDEDPPYEVLQTDAIDFENMQRLKRFAHLWGRIVNEGSFCRSAELLWRDGSPFARFMAFADAVFEANGRVHAISLENMARGLAAYLIEVRHLPADLVEQHIRADFRRAGRPEPKRLTAARKPAPETRSGPPRQARHAGPEDDVAP